MDAMFTIAHFAAPAEERVCLVKEEDSVAGFRLLENARQVLLGLADVFADDRREVDLVKVQPKLSRHYLRRHGIARAGRAGEERIETLAERELLIESPLLVDQCAVFDVVADLAQLLKPVGRQNDVRPAVLRLNFLCQRGKLLIRVITTGRIQIF